MSELRRGERRTTPSEDAPAETARRMVRALTYLMQVSAAAGLPRVTAKLAVAQAELLVASGQTLIDLEARKQPHDGSRRHH